MSTHTYAKLEVSLPVYDEIRKALEEAGYQHAFHEDGLIDMHGIALAPGFIELPHDPKPMRVEGRDVDGDIGVLVVRR